MLESAEWMTDAACLDSDPELFFPEYTYQVATAIAICNECPVRQMCRDYAIDADIHYGVYGGATPTQRGTPFRGPRKKKVA